VLLLPSFLEVMLCAGFIAADPLSEDIAVSDEFGVNGRVQLFDRTGKVIWQNCEFSILIFMDLQLMKMEILSCANQITVHSKNGNSISKFPETWRLSWYFNGNIYINHSIKLYLVQLLLKFWVHVLE